MLDQLRFQGLMKKYIANLQNEFKLCIFKMKTLSKYYITNVCRKCLKKQGDASIHQDITKVVHIKHNKEIESWQHRSCINS